MNFPKFIQSKSKHDATQDYAIQRPLIPIRNKAKYQTRQATAQHSAVCIYALHL